MNQKYGFKLRIIVNNPSWVVSDIKKTYPLFYIGLTVFLLAYSQHVSANAGVPMIFLAMPALLISIVPIILIEALYISRSLSFSLKKAAKTSVYSNIGSTLVGVPLTWGVLVLVQMIAGGGSAYGLETTQDKILAVTLQAAWLIPYESEMHWMIPAAGLILIVPFFLASWLTEYFIAKKLNVDTEPRLISRCMFVANLITYSLMSIWPIYWYLMKTN